MHDPRQGLIVYSNGFILVPCLDQVTAQHILLGLIAEGSTRDGYMGTSITLEGAREIIEGMSSKQKKREVKELPFSRDSKRVFETALTVTSRVGLCSTSVPSCVAVQTSFP